MKIRRIDGNIGDEKQTTMLAFRATQISIKKNPQYTVFTSL